MANIVPAYGDDDADTAPSANRGQQLDPDDPMLQFFKQFGFPLPQQGQRGFGRQMPQEVPVAGEGSGFIVSADGTILTNAHVVKGAKTVTVRLTDRREFKAKVLGQDDKTDVAVLKIDAGTLPTIQVDPDAPRVGDVVLAIGNPFGIGTTVTSGIVSARGRDLHSGPYDDFIQIDAPINHGNSGGPLVDAKGQVVGINTAIYSPNGGSVGVGFAIPSDQAQKVVTELMKDGSIQHGFIGVQIQPVTADIADAIGLAQPEGALVAGVNGGTPAAKAGIKAGDVITALGGNPVKSPRDLSRMVADLSPGTSKNVSVWRTGKTKDVPITIGDNAADQQ